MVASLFLDEIGEMPVGMQVKLLRPWRSGTVRPVGSNTTIPFNARLIAATNRNLDAAVQDKTFRGSTTEFTRHLDRRPTAPP